MREKLDELLLSAIALGSLVLGVLLLMLATSLLIAAIIRLWEVV